MHVRKIDRSSRVLHYDTRVSNYYFILDNVTLQSFQKCIAKAAFARFIIGNSICQVKKRRNEKEKIDLSKFDKVCLTACTALTKCMIRSEVAKKGDRTKKFEKEKRHAVARIHFSTRKNSISCIKLCRKLSPITGARDFVYYFDKIFRKFKIEF